MRIIVVMIINPDINECLQGLCDQNCTNTNGSYTCNCTAGFTLDSDGHLCNGKYILTAHDTIICFLDINECLTDNGGCGDSSCVNTNGSYSCSCQPGYTLDADGHNCTGILVYS